MRLRGSLRIFFLYDVAEALDPDKLRDLLGPRGGIVRQVFPRRTPEYVRFEQSPIIEAAPPLELPNGEHIDCSLKYYSFAVVVLQLEVPFDSDWNGLLAQASRWTDTSDVEPRARQIVREH